MHRLKILLGIIDNLSEWTGNIVRFSVLIITLLIVIEVVLRYIFNAPTGWAHETSTMLFGTAWVIGGAYTLRHNRHVSMDIIYNHVSSRWRGILDVVGTLLLFIFVGILLWKGWDYAWLSLSKLEHSNTPWSPPLYPVKLMIPIGAFLLLLQGIAKFIRGLITAVTGRD